MQKNKWIAIVLLSLRVLATANPSLAQSPALPETPFYINLNTASSSAVFKIQDERLNLSYYDQYGKRAEAPLRIYDARQQVVAQVDIQKSFGQNYYTIDLKELFNGWEKETFYTCALTDESGRRLPFTFKLVDAPEKSSPAISVFAEPVHLTCEAATSATVRFYGDIAGGKAPYRVKWHVLDGSQTHLLYQPWETTVEKAGNTTAITVDAIPGYYVLMEVKDACGNMVRQMLHINCGEDAGNAHTLFVQTMVLPPSTPSGN